MILLKIPCLAVSILCLAALSGCKPEGVEQVEAQSGGSHIFAEFATEIPADWTVTGESWRLEEVPAGGMRLSTAPEGERIGAVESPEFTITHDFVHVLARGKYQKVNFDSKEEEDLAVEIRMAEATLKQICPEELSDEMEWWTLPTRQLIGQKATLRLVDGSRASDALMQIERILFSNDPAPGQEPFADEESEIVRSGMVDGDYCVIPINENAPRQAVHVTVGERSIVRMNAHVDPVNPDYWMAFDVSPWKGQKADFQVPAGADAAHKEAVLAARFSDEIPGKDLGDLFHRPKFHYTTRTGKSGDVTGVIHYDGEYHLMHTFFGPWGHSVGTDLLNWREIAPPFWSGGGDSAFSGTVFLDHRNDLGVATGDEPPMVIARTQTNAGESLYYSNDRGRTWDAFAGNPVLTHGYLEARGDQYWHDSRDPKILWWDDGAGGGHWVMVVYDQPDRFKRNGEDCRFGVFVSDDLQNWRRTQTLPGWYECPDFFQVKLDGDPAKRYWVLMDAAFSYSIGSFDGERFEPLFRREDIKAEPLTAPSRRFLADIPERFPGRQGGDFYASQTFGNMPDDRVVLMGWLNKEIPGLPFKSRKSFPMELTLRTTDQGPRLFVNPIREITDLQKSAHTLTPVTLEADGENPFGELAPANARLLLDLEPSEDAAFTLDILGETLAYDAATGEFAHGKTRFPVPLEEGRLRMELLVDGSIIEVMLQGGRHFLPIVAPLEEGGKYDLDVSRGHLVLKSGVVHDMAR